MHHAYDPCRDPAASRPVHRRCNRPLSDSKRGRWRTVALLQPDATSARQTYQHRRDFNGIVPRVDFFGFSDRILLFASSSFKSSARLLLSSSQLRPPSPPRRQSLTHHFPNRGGPWIILCSRTTLRRPKIPWMILTEAVFSFEELPWRGGDRSRSPSTPPRPLLALRCRAAFIAFSYSEGRPPSPSIARCCPKSYA